ncbi:MAG: DedA family protein [Candidatus Pacebacteria bacterium]|nr:DedA family protein [Candidatus Paceibacterota bacterium]MBP9851666.1 DedA family protein [Candidatus Paceibacterota bacterium]
MFSIETFSTLGLLGLAIAIFAETGLLVGIVFPGDSLIFAFGILAAVGKMSFIGTIIVTAVASFLGYEVSYYLGKKYGTKFFEKNDSGLISISSMQRAERYYTRFGVLTLLFARFIPVLRTVAGPLAGIGKMHRRTFMIYNAIGAIIWPVVVAGIGYFFGQLVPNPDRFIMPIIIIVVALSLIAPVFINMYHKYTKRKKAKQHSAGNHTAEKGNE